MRRDIFSVHAGKKKSLIDSISWDISASDHMAHRFSDLSLRFGSQVIVKENQSALFFRDGKILDEFGPGRHTISSANIPLLTDLIRALRIIGDIFDCEIVYINKSQIRTNFGGKGYSARSGPIGYQAEIPFYGYALIKIVNPILFIKELFGNLPNATAADFKNYIIGFVNQKIIRSFAKLEISYLAQNIEIISNHIQEEIRPDTAIIGIHLLNLKFDGIEIPEEARRFTTSIGQQAMTMQYLKETAGEIGNSGAGGAFGMGAGMIMPWMIMQQHAQTSSQNKITEVADNNKCYQCGTEVDKSTKFCPNCGVKLVSKKCPDCSNDSSPETKFCPSCGHKFD